MGITNKFSLTSEDRKEVIGFCDDSYNRSLYLTVQEAIHRGWHPPKWWEFHKPRWPKDAIELFYKLKSI